MRWLVRLLWKLVKVAIFVALLAAVLWLELRTIRGAGTREMLAAGEAMLEADRVVAVVGHPDDAEYWISGSLKRLADNGARVTLVVASDGEKGRNLVGSPNLGATRRAEQAAAGEVLGYSRIVFLGQPDRAAARGDEVGDLIAQEIDRENPDIVITFDGSKPQPPYFHHDHEGIGRITVSVLERRGYEGGIYLFHTRRPDVAVEIEDVMEAKMEAISKHVSQNGGALRTNWPRRIRQGSLDFSLPASELFRRLQ